MALERWLGISGILLLGCGPGTADGEPDASAGGHSAGTSATAGSGGSLAQAGAASGGAAGSGGSLAQAGAASGGAAGNGGSGPAGGQAGSTPGVVETCSAGAPNAVLPQDAPALEVGVWKNITPAGIPLGDAEDMIGQGLALDPCDMKILYWGNTPFNSGLHGGLYKSTNAGTTWDRVGLVDEPLHVRVDPRDPQHLYSGSGVRGATLGFWDSTDGGENWTKPAGWTAAGTSAGYFIDDVYDVAVDPTDFDHILVSSHSSWKWEDAVIGNAAGVMESTDGGETWTVHQPENTWGAGHSINFLYDPASGQGNAQTWLLGTQGDGQWRTSDGGQSWTKVSNDSIFHGGGDVYYAADGVLYAASGSSTLRSENNGETWNKVGPNVGTTAVWGNGDLLFTAAAYGFGAQPFWTTGETDGTNWTASTQMFDNSGPFEMTYDAANKILYASMWFQGIWALKLAN